jgi:hypothetical protein
MRYPYIMALVIVALSTIAATGQKVKPQPTKPQPVKQPAKDIIKDTFAFNVLTTIDKVLRIAEDPKQHPMQLAGELLKSSHRGGGIYQSTINIPGSVGTEFNQSSTDRDKQTTSWEWTATMIDTPKGQYRDAAAIKQKLDSLIVNFKNRSKSSIYVSGAINDKYYDRDRVVIYVTIFKGLHNTEQQAIDSVVNLYRPLLSNRATADECSQKFTKALDLEGVKQPRIIEIFTDLFKEIANKNLGAAFDMLVGGPHYIDVQIAKSVLSYSQQEEIKNMASRKVDEFYGRNYPKPDVVVEKKKEIEQQQAPTDPCKKQIWELRIKPGWYISGNGRTAYVTEYSCATHTYTIAWVNDAKKLVFEKNLSPGAMAVYTGTSSSPFTICGHCKGIGYSMENDWYQVNVASNYYAKSDKQRKYSCGVCSGSGYIKLR